MTNVTTKVELSGNFFTHDPGKTLYATSGAPVPFMQFMDHIARQLGTRLPLHVPLMAEPLFKWVVRKEHVQQTALAMPARSPSPRVPGWKPAWPDYRDALYRIVVDWGA